MIVGVFENTEAELVTMEAEGLESEDSCPTNAVSSNSSEGYFMRKTKMSGDRKNGKAGV